MDNCETWLSYKNGFCPNVPGDDVGTGSPKQPRTFVVEEVKVQVSVLLHDFGE